MKPEDQKFTHKEWTGTTYTGLDGSEENAWDVVGINREPAATSTVPYESVDKAVTGAVDYAKDQSAYVQMLSGSGEKIGSLSWYPTRKRARSTWMTAL